ncbi:MAG: FliI/YscN family ATPase [Candidatus Eremiobacterota bacterium]
MALDNSTVRQITGSVVETEELSGNIGDLCYIIPEDKNKEPVRAEIIGFREKKALLLPFGELADIVPGCKVRVTGNVLQVEVGEQLIGRILNGLGEPIDGKGSINSGIFHPVYNDCPDSSVCLPVNKPLSTGCKVIDSVLTFGKGQRLGLFAGGGMGKSTTLGLIARENGADINVLIFVGERGRELRDLVEHVLKEKGLGRSVIIVATSDRPAIEKIKCCYTGIAIAEYFRDNGKDVMMMVDTVTRFAMAQREIGLATGEKPEAKCYTPSVFTVLSKLLNRPASTGTGTITSLYTVLVDGDDMDEPVAASVHSALDGHIKLKRKLVYQQIFPCIDIAASKSPFFKEITTEEHKKAARAYLEAWSLYEDAEDLISIGAYKAGGNPKLDWAVKNFERIAEFRKQKLSDICPFDTTIKNLIELMSSDESPWYSN